jgi:hypothetical protein
MSDITPNQWTILESLQDGPRWIRSFQAVKPLLNDLIQRGMVCRCKPFLGRANNMVRLTEAGCAKLEIDPLAVPEERDAMREPLHRAKRWSLHPIKANTTAFIRRTCERFMASVKTGTSFPDAVGELAEAEGVQRPAIWRRLRAGGIIDPIRTGVRKHPARIPLIANDITPERVDRDGCPRCGVRADIGCKHNRAPLGMML